MYLSRLLFNPLDRKVRHALRDAYNLHATLMQGFADNQTHSEARILFRQEPECTPWIPVLVQSPQEPDWQALRTQFAHALHVACKPLNLNFSEGQVLRFRLRANPVVNKAEEKGKKSKRHGLTGEEAQRQWLERRAAGFALHNYVVIDEGFMKATKKKAGEKDQWHQLAICSVRYEGLLCVTQPQTFLEQVVKKGIGPAKGLGCGLLSVSRAN